MQSLNVKVFSKVPHDPNLMYVYRLANQQEKKLGQSIVIDYTIAESELIKELNGESYGKSAQ